MDYKLVMGGILASIWALVLFYRLIGKYSKVSMNNFKDEMLKRRRKEICLPEMAATPEVIIVGAGVAGSALAYALGKDGCRVHVIERDLNEPDRIVGELLQPGGYLKLIELGPEDCVEQIDAQQIFGYAIFKNGKSSKLSYPLMAFHNSNVARRSFHNGRFIQRMREKLLEFTKTEKYSFILVFHGLEFQKLLVFSKSESAESTGVTEQNLPSSFSARSLGSTHIHNPFNS